MERCVYEPLAEISGSVSAEHGVGYPDAQAERKILELVRDETAANATDTPPPEVSQQSVFAARKALLGLHMTESVERYIVALVMATRQPNEAQAKWIEFGASPRATIALDICSRALAWLQDRDYVTPEDVQAVAHDVLRHRLILTFEADAQGVSADQVIDALLQEVPVP